MKEEKREPELDIDEKKVEEWFKNKFSGDWCKPRRKIKKVPKSGSGAYFLGFLGAAIYYISVATTFWVGVLGVLKAIIWPVFLVFELFKFLGL